MKFTEMHMQELKEKCDLVIDSFSKGIKNWSGMDIHRVLELIHRK
jgi:predicted ribonuclease toxin of YeeF-YezG toxin-antitoxin module